ncbi:MAG: biotin--[Lachnospiraceae bacterium]|nr:biotin--[acetyl-CoA-carboxylase] ligase [Lachnospiraceae bacterium]
MISKETDVLSEEMMRSLLRTEYIGSRLFCLSQVDSTNEELKRRFMADGDLPDGTVAITSDQTAGKGRRGRSWVTPPGANIAMSILLRPEIDPSAASMLTIVAALAVSRACSELTGLGCQIKWPNDVVADGKKICGILTEMSVKPALKIEYVIVGIGVNVNTPSFPPDLSDKATSLKLLCDRSFDKNKLAALILTYFEKLHNEFLKCRNLEFMMAEYNALLVSQGKTVRVLDPKGEYEGISAGINDKGELLVKMSDGTERQVYAGEVSVRGVYGYV